MSGESAKLRRELEGFEQSTRKLSGGITGVGDIWNDQNYAALQSQIHELAKSSKTVIESGKNTCSRIDNFFKLAKEDI